MRRRERLFARMTTLAYYVALLPTEVLANAPAQAEFEGPSSSIILIIPYFFSLGMLLTVVSESQVARLFRMEDWERRRIRWTNFFSQILMRVLFLALPLGYIGAVVLTEVVVYVGEFLLYRKILPNHSVRRLLAYTIAANTVSLILGIILNYLLLN